MSHTLGELAKYVGGRVEGDASCVIDNVASLVSAEQNQISFYAGGKHSLALAGTKAGAVIITVQDTSLTSTNCLIVENPQLAFAMIATKLNPSEIVSGIHRDASIDPDAKIDSSAYIGAPCVISAGVEIKRMFMWTHHVLLAKIV